MDKQTFNRLIDKYLQGTSSAAETALLNEYADQLAATSRFTVSPAEEAQLKETMYQNILKSIRVPETIRVPMYRQTWFRIAAAAVIIVMVTAGLYFIVSKPGTQPSVATNTQSVQDVLPGKEGAILTLADGKTIVLDSTFGTIANESGVALVNQDGQLVYEVSRLPSDDSRLPSPDSRLPSDVSRLTYHTMTTPRGRQYQLVLADGTKVWLNAASSITFPTAFAGNQRKVQITGEAYFEVAKDQSKPFHVSVNGMEVQVLGTHFNINSYGDEGSIKTTLLEGSVKVTANNNQQTANSLVLKPGQQAEHLANSSQLTANSSVDLDEVMAWKNGKFSYSNADLPTIMRQMARWYDVEVVYQANITDRYTVQVPRTVPVSQLFRFLEMSGGVKFEIKDRQIIVKKP